MLFRSKKVTPSVVPTADVPFATKDAASKFPVTLWVSSDCGEFCVKGRDLLNKRGVPFTESNPENRDNLEAFKKVAGSEPMVPILQGGTLRTIRGFGENEWNQALDGAGYAKSGPANKPAAKPPATPAPAADGKK